VGKTWKDDKVISRHKKGARLATLDMDLRTRTKPVEKKERGGGKNWRNIIDAHLEEDYDNDIGD
jgi:hypothetical protein